MHDGRPAICTFTQAKPDTGGVELLTACMNTYFSQVIDLMMAHGGDVVKFAGDSMIVAFRPAEGALKPPVGRWWWWWRDRVVSCCSMPYPGNGNCCAALGSSNISSFCRPAGLPATEL